MARIANAGIERRDEIEITPEMVRAGAAAVIDYHPEYGTPADETAVNVFRVMAEIAGLAINKKDEITGETGA